MSIQSISKQEQSQLRGKLDSNNVSDVLCVYSVLAASGHRYARLAEGVADGNMLSGLTAIQYM